MARSNNSSRIELGFGGGHIDCLLNLATGSIERYHGDSRDFPRYNAEKADYVRDADGIHSRLGGKQYYQSRSGCSGAGWIPAKPTLKRLGTYRVDVGGVLLGFSSEREFAPHVSQFEIRVPFSYRGGDIREYPVVVREPDGKITLLSEWQLAQFLRGGVETEVREFVFSYLKDSTSGESKLVAKIYQPKDRYESGDNRAMRLLVEGFHHAALSFVYPEGWQAEGDGEFWKRLGFRRLPDGLYKVVRNICRYMVDEWVDLAEIQKWIPANVHMLAPHLYVQERNGAYVAVARFAYDGAWFDYEVELASDVAFRVFAGNREDISKLEQQLELGARNKHGTERADRARSTLYAHQQEERTRIIRELCEQFADLEVTLEDSYAAGNCQPGTEDFRNKEFPGKTKTTVKMLSRFLAVHGVRRVLEHILLPRAEGQIPVAPTPPGQMVFTDEQRAKRRKVLDTFVLESPRGEADDLKRIIGVNGKIEQRLNDAGVFHFWQIARLDAVQLEALDRTLRLRGQIQKDNWVEQAQKLSSGE